EKVESRVPAYRHERVATAAVVAAGAALQPAAADHGLSDAGTMVQGTGQIVADAVRIGVAAIGTDFKAAVAHPRREHAPVRGMGTKAVRQIEAGIGAAECVHHKQLLKPASSRLLLPAFAVPDALGATTAQHPGSPR